MKTNYRLDGNKDQLTGKIEAFQPVNGTWWVQDCAEPDRYQVADEIATAIKNTYGFPVEITLYRTDGRAFFDECPDEGTMLVTRACCPAT